MGVQRAHAIGLVVSVDVTVEALVHRARAVGGDGVPVLLELGVCDDGVASAGDHHAVSPPVLRVVVVVDVLDGCLRVFGDANGEASEAGKLEVIDSTSLVAVRDADPVRSVLEHPDGRGALNPELGEPDVVALGDEDRGLFRCVDQGGATRTVDGDAVG